LPADLPANVRSLVERALSKDPAERFPDGAALLAAVDDVLSGRPPVPPSRTRTAVMPMPSGAAHPVTPTAAPAPVPSASGARAAVRMLVGALAVLVVLAVVVLVVRANGESSAGAGDPAETTAPATAATVDLVAADLVGRPVRDVQAELVARGLQVSIVPVETGEVPAGLVTSVDPVGGLAVEAVVTVTYAVPPVVVPAPDQSDDQGNSGNTGNGNGNGNGGGNDKGKKDKDDD
jgi:serine/threonine-protein kinase